MSTEPIILKELLLKGYSIDYKRLSLSSYERMGKIYFQVHSDDYRHPHSKMFQDVVDAIRMFLQLKNDFYKKVR